MHGTIDERNGMERSNMSADFDSLYLKHCVLLKRLESKWFFSLPPHSPLFHDGHRRPRAACGLGHRMPFLRRNLSYIRSPPTAVSAREDEVGSTTANRVKRSQIVVNGAIMMNAKKRKLVVDDNVGATKGGAGEPGEKGARNRRHWRRRKASSSSDAVWEVFDASSSPSLPLDGGIVCTKPVNLLLRCFRHTCQSVNPALLQNSSHRSTRAMRAAESSTPSSPAPANGLAETPHSTPKDEFLSCQSREEKVVGDVELASDVSVEERVGRRNDGTGVRRALVLSESKMKRATRLAVEELRGEARKVMEVSGESEEEDGSGGGGPDPASLPPIISLGSNEAKEEGELWNANGSRQNENDEEGEDDDEVDILSIPPIPPYVPIGKDGRLVRPRPPRTSYQLFVLAERDAARRSLPFGPDRCNKGKIERRLKKIWRNLSAGELKRYVKEEIRDNERHAVEIRVYSEAKRRKTADGNRGMISLSSGADLEGTSSVKDGTRKRRRRRRDDEGGDESDNEVDVAGSCRVASSSVDSRASALVGNGPNVFFHFTYLDPEDRVPAIRVEMRKDWSCPICFYRCGTLHGLTKHGQTFHEPDVSFQLIGKKGENFHVRVNAFISGAKPPHLSSVSFTDSSSPAALEKLKEFVQIRPSPSGLEECEKLRVLSCGGSNDQISLDDGSHSSKDLMLTVCEHGEAKSMSDDFPLCCEKSQMPQRQYYHSRTNLPMLTSDWRDGTDSDDEPDDTWLRRMGEELMDDFDDVSSDEKAFMNSWNRFMRRHTVVGDRAVPGLCLEFVAIKGRWLVERGLRQNLLCHLFAMWDDGVVSSEHMLKIMAAYDDVAGQLDCSDRESTSGASDGEMADYDSQTTSKTDSGDHKIRKVGLTG